MLERDQTRVEDAVARGLRAEWGDSTKRDVLQQAHIATARLLVIATPESADSQRIAKHGRELNPNLSIVARTRRPGEVDFMLQQGIADEDIVVNDVEVGLTIIRRSLNRVGVSDRDALETLRLIRQGVGAYEDDEDVDAGSPYAAFRT
jgi:CPA2 family monovalent cation:H+ antiporter-2